MRRFNLDPLNEEEYSPLPGLIHKYSNRVLVIITSACADYCSFCTRKRIRGANFQITDKQISAIKKYLLKRREVKEIIFSGGDPLMAPKAFKKAINILGRINSIKIIRLHTRLPVVRPRLINREILTPLAALSPKPLYVCLHINHPREINKDVVAAIERLRKIGAIILSQTVFIKELNDSVSVLEKLFSRLVEVGVKPYYLFHCDQIYGNEKFIVNIKNEIKIVTELRRRLSGLAFPLHTIDASGGFGKVPAPTDFWVYDARFFRDFKGKKIRMT